MSDKKEKQKKETKKKTTKPVKKEVPHEVFKITDRLDEEVITAEIVQAIKPSELVYHYPEKGHEIWGLSIAGVNEAVRILREEHGLITIEEPPDIKFTDKGVLATVVVKMASVKIKDGELVTIPAGQRSAAVLQPWKMKEKMKKNGKVLYEDGKPLYREIDDPFAVQKAVGKAYRNAKMKLIPAAVVNRIIEEAKGEGKVREISPEEVKEVQYEVVDETKEDMLLLLEGETATKNQIEFLNNLLQSSKVKDTVKERIKKEIDEGGLSKERASFLIKELLNSKKEG